MVSRISPGGRHGNPLQYSPWRTPLDRGAWWATVHGVTKSRTWLSNTAHSYIWQNSHIDSLPLWCEKAKWKPQELSLPRKIEEQKQYCISRDTVEVRVTIKILKNARVMILTTLPFSSPIWLMQKTDGSWRMNGDYHMLKPGGDFNYSAGADEILLLEYINSSPGTGMQLLIWSNVLFSISVSKTNQKQSAFSWQGQKHSFTICLSGISNL